MADEDGFLKRDGDHTLRSDANIGLPGGALVACSVAVFAARWCDDEKNRLALALIFEPLLATGACAARAAAILRSYSSSSSSFSSATASGMSQLASRVVSESICFALILGRLRGGSDGRALGSPSPSASSLRRSRFLRTLAGAGVT